MRIQNKHKYLFHNQNTPQQLIEILYSTDNHFPSFISLSRNANGICIQGFRFLHTADLFGTAHVTACFIRTYKNSTLKRGCCSSLAILRCHFFSDNCEDFLFTPADLHLSHIQDFCSLSLRFALIVA